MSVTASQLHHAEERFFTNKIKKANSWLKLYWFRISILCFLSFIFLRKDFTIEFNLNSTTALVETANTIIDQTTESSFWSNLSTANSFLPVIEKSERIIAQSPAKEIKQKDTDQNIFDKNESRSELFNLFDDNTSNTYSNMTYKSKTTKKVSANKTRKVKKQNAYVKRFSSVAQSEMEKFGIPASITLAQGLIESNAGESKLATRNNNHFGMKCFSKKCKKGHCSNFTDDSHKDFFRTYSSAWESYRAHSKMLMNKRYSALQQYGNDYKAWAHGLKSAGYATDKNYASKLIHIIEELELDRFDN